MLKLYYYPGNASMCIHVLLRELDVPFELVLVDRAVNAQRSAEYLQLNPNGTIPVLVDGALVLHETAAILLHLADAHPNARLAPALGTPERATAYNWLFWMSNTLQATLMTSVYPERWVEAPDESVVAQLKRQAQRRVGGQLELLDAQLRASGGPWVLGEAFSVLDPLAFMLCLWTRNFDEAIAAPARLRPALGPYMERVLSRSSVQRVLADEGFRAPRV